VNDQSDRVIGEEIFYSQQLKISTPPAQTLPKFRRFNSKGEIISQIERESEVESLSIAKEILGEEPNDEKVSSLPVANENATSGPSLLASNQSLKRSLQVQSQRQCSPLPSPILCNILSAYPKLNATPPNVKRSVDESDANPNPQKFRKLNTISHQVASGDLCEMDGTSVSEGDDPNGIALEDEK
jgi:hypothetical protein